MLRHPQFNKKLRTNEPNQAIERVSYNFTTQSTYLQILNTECLTTCAFRADFRSYEYFRSSSLQAEYAVSLVFQPIQIDHAQHLTNEIDQSILTDSTYSQMVCFHWCFETISQHKNLWKYENEVTLSLLLYFDKMRNFYL